MSCDVHFDTTIRGGIVGICGCGFVGQPQDNWDGFRTGYECPKCGEEAKVDLIMDVGTAHRIVTKKWPDGNTYEKTIKTSIMELRMNDDPRNMSEWVAKKGASAILWEVLRALEPNMPKKPKWKTFESKADYFKAKDEYKSFWRNVFRKEYTITELYKGKMREVFERNNPYGDEAKTQTRAILMAMGIDLKKVKMSNKFQFVSMASKLADKRAGAALKVVNARMTRTTVNALLERIGENERFDELRDFLLGISSEFGNVYIRTSVIKAMKLGDRFMPGMRVIRMATYKPFEKSAWKHKAFMEEHPEFFASPEFSMDRGALVTEEDGSSWIYDSVWKGMIQVSSPWQDLSLCTKARSHGGWKMIDLVPYNENVGEDDQEEDSWIASAVADEPASIEEELDTDIEEDSDIGSDIDETDDVEDSAVA